MQLRRRRGDAYGVGCPTSRARTPLAVYVRGPCWPQYTQRPPLRYRLSTTHPCSSNCRQRASRKSVTGEYSATTWRPLYLRTHRGGSTKGREAHAGVRLRRAMKRELRAMRTWNSALPMSHRRLNCQPIVVTGSTAAAASPITLPPSPASSPAPSLTGQRRSNGYTRAATRRCARAAR